MTDSIVQEKQCSKCKIIKPIDDFPNDRKAKGGKRCQCKICVAEITKKYRDSPKGQEAYRRFSESPARKESVKKYTQTRKFKIQQQRYKKSEKGRATATKEQAKLLQKQRARKHWLKRYGITLIDYDLMFARQNGLCAICDQPSTDKRLNIDHCHKSGEVRGLLCGHCNRAIGLLRDNTQNALNAYRYLLRHQNK